MFRHGVDMSRPARAIIHLDAIHSNYLLARSLAPQSRALAVVKADAYGHGAVPVAQTLAAEADGFAVACLEEGLALRSAGIRTPILLLEGFFEAEELGTIAQQNFWCTVHSEWQLDILSRAQLPRPITVWLKLDTGMHRVGIAPNHYRAAYARASQMPQVASVTTMTHLASADAPDSDTTRYQLACFDQVTANLGAPASIANSAATLAWPDTHRDWLRPGMMLYGANPIPAGAALAPAMTLESKIIAIRDLDQGDAVGYGGDFICNGPTRVATVALGYGDGYPRHAPTGTPVYVQGQRSRLVGRVSMDMLSIDVSALPQVKVGDTVEFWGSQLSLQAVSDYCGTIPYTLVTGLLPRVPRHYRANLQAQFNHTATAMTWA